MDSYSRSSREVRASGAGRHVTKAPVCPFHGFTVRRTAVRAVTRHERLPWLPATVQRHPLQTGKFVGVLLAVVLFVGGFLRLLDGALAGDSLLGDGQFLALVLLPVVGFGLVAVVFLETLVAGYRVVRSDRSVGEQLSGRGGYVLLRGLEAGIAVLGVLVMSSALPSLFAESTPAPIGVGIMLLLAVVTLAILFASLVRSGAELFVYGG